MTSTAVSTQDLIKEFANASINEDFNTIEEILNEKCEFEIQDNELELVDTNKAEFLSWYKNKLKEIIITDVI